MDNLRLYLLSLICAALLCSIVSSIAKCTENKKLIKLLCSLFLLLCLISPLTHVDLSDITLWSDTYAEEAYVAVEEGKDIASEMRLRCITQELETYILDKAEAMNLELTVDITVDQDGIPRDIILHGMAEPYQKERISLILDTDLGIPKENQTWTGSH